MLIFIGDHIGTTDNDKLLNNVVISDLNAYSYYKQGFSTKQ